MSFEQPDPGILEGMIDKIHKENDRQLIILSCADALVNVSVRFKETCYTKDSLCDSVFIFSGKFSLLFSCVFLL